MLHRYHKTDPGYPHCGEYEDIDHIFTCPSLAAAQGRTPSVSAISRNIKGTKTGSEWISVYQLILLCMTMESIPTLPIATKYKAGLKEQLMIGTLHFVQGKISRLLARDIYSTSCPTKKSYSFFEAQLRIKSIWLAALQIWRARNDAKHGNTLAGKRKIQKIAFISTSQPYYGPPTENASDTHAYPEETNTPSQPNTCG
jgi:hypothetical protein